MPSALHMMLESSRKLRENFDQEKCVSANLYIQHFRHISEMLNCLGMIFSFVTKDIDAKISVLKTHMQKQNAETLDEIIVFEVKNKCTTTKKPRSATRTLLRLHRALEFVQHFLERLHPLLSKQSAAPAAQEAYQGTLSKHHSWPVRKTVQLALRTLDNKDALLHRVTDGRHADDAVQTEHIKKLCQDLNSVWKHIEAIFNEHDLHCLP